MTVGSWPSGPWMALNTRPQSSTVRAMGPILSMLQLRAMAPWRLTRPKVGRRPVVPHTVDGDTMEPSVSVPIPNGSKPADTAEAVPADEPLEPVSGCHGLRVRPPNQMSPVGST